jgi:hypothetical protein
MTKDDPKVLEAAYSAVKMQRMNADIRDLWGGDSEGRDNFVSIEEVLKLALIDAKRRQEENRRGGVKPRTAVHETV